MKPQTCAKARELVWGNLIHLSYNMWGDRKPHDSWIKGHPCGDDIYAKPYLRFDEPLWNELLERMADIGMNMVVLDLGVAVRYASHQEIAVKGAWCVT